MTANSSRALVLHHSQSGQTAAVAQAFVRGFVQGGGTAEAVAVDPEYAEPFPWSFTRFFDWVPETALGQGTDIKPLGKARQAEADLVVLCYPVWFLSPAPAIARLLDSADGQALIRGRNVITISTARAMWAEAQRTVAAQVDRLEGRLLGHIPLTFGENGPLSFLSAPLWMFSGRKGPFMRGLIPVAGLDVASFRGIEQTARLIAMNYGKEPVSIAITHNNVNQIAERIGLNYFRAFGRVMQKIGARGNALRRGAVPFFVLGLVALVLVVLPFSGAVRHLRGRGRGVDQTRQISISPQNTSGAT